MGAVAARRHKQHLTLWLPPQKVVLYLMRGDTVFSVLGLVYQIPRLSLLMFQGYLLLSFR